MSVDAAELDTNGMLRLILERLDRLEAASEAKPAAAAAGTQLQARQTGVPKPKGLNGGKPTGASGPSCGVAAIDGVMTGMSSSSTTRKASVTSRDIFNRRSSSAQSYSDEVVDEVGRLMTDPDFDRVLHEVQDTMHRGGSSTSRTLSTSRYVLPHDGHFRLYWDASILVLVLFSCALIPLRIAFHEDIEYDARSEDAWARADIVIDTIFMLDVRRFASPRDATLTCGPRDTPPHAPEAAFSHTRTMPFAPPRRARTVARTRHSH